MLHLQSLRTKKTRRNLLLTGRDVEVGTRSPAQDEQEHRNGTKGWAVACFQGWTSSTVPALPSTVVLSTDASTSRLQPAQPILVYETFDHPSNHLFFLLKRPMHTHLKRFW